jgi:hypothetical protein
MLLLALLFPATARADFTVATLQRPSPVSAYAGHVVWSQWDGTAFQLTEAHASPSGLVTTALPVPRRFVPFDADIGPGPDGAPTVVYSRCATDPPLGPDGLPVWARGRGCRLFRYALGAAAEERIGGAGSEFLPSIWRGRIAFARVYDRLPYLYVRGSGASQRQPGGMRGETGLPGPTSLDLAGIRLGFTWATTTRQETRLDTTTGGHELLEFTTGANRLRSAFVFAGRVWWASIGNPLRVYRRWRIANRGLEQADIPASRLPTLAIAPQSVTSVFWSQPTLIGGDGFVSFVATL